VVVAAQQGDASACDTLARECQRAAFLFALQLTGNRDDALDVAQDALLRFFASLNRFDSSRPVRPWLLRIVRNLVHDRFRRSRVRRTQSMEGIDDTPALDPVDPAEDPESGASRRELQHLLWDALQTLPQIHREVLVLRDYQDLSYGEIAKTLRIPQGTVMSRLHRARMLISETVNQRVNATREDSND